MGNAYLEVRHFLNENSAEANNARANRMAKAWRTRNTHALENAHQVLPHDIGLACQRLRRMHIHTCIHKHTRTHTHTHTHTLQTASAENARTAAAFGLSTPWQMVVLEPFRVLLHLAADTIPAMKLKKHHSRSAANSCKSRMT